MRTYFARLVQICKNLAKKYFQYFESYNYNMPYVFENPVTLGNKIIYYGVFETPCFTTFITGTNSIQKCPNFIGL